MEEDLSSAMEVALDMEVGGSGPFGIADDVPTHYLEVLTA